jgi:predicted CopG family antitoxin
MRKILTLTLGLFAITAFGQKSEKVELNWKINSGETLSYQTVMTEIDTSTVKFNFGGLFNALSDSTNENIDEAQKLFEELNKSFQNIDFVTNLTNKKNGIIDIVMQTRPKENVEEVKSDTLDEKMAEMMKMMQSMSQGVMLRGSVFETGGIHSFWVKSNQKNLIAIFFELPQNPVKVGDTWELDVNLIANDQNFECDSAYKVNKVTLTDLKSKNNETIAVLKYEIIEFVDGTFHSPSFMGKGGPTKTMMKFTYQAIAEFSIEKGRWISYDGIMSLEASGIMTSNTKKKFSLIRE